MKKYAMIHSIKNIAEVEILEWKDNNNIIAEYQGRKCTAIFNPFTNLIYVDDVYGVITE